MGKKEKTEFATAAEFQAMSALAPKLAVFVKVYQEISNGYHKYRKNGGAAIPGIEKHMGIKEEKTPSVVKEKNVTPVVVKEPTVETAAKKTKKKIKK
jgi:hypothetical protein